MSYEVGCVCRFKPVVPRSVHDGTHAVCDGRCNEDASAMREVIAWVGTTTPLRRARNYRGLSLREAAKAVGLSPGGLSQLENGHYEPRVATAIRLARFYETTVEELFGDQH